MYLLFSFFVFPFSYYYCSHVAWRQDKVDATFSVKTKSDCKNASCAIYTVHASSIVHFYPVSMYISIVPACGIVYHYCVMHLNSRSRCQYIGKNKSLWTLSCFSVCPQVQHMFTFMCNCLHTVESIHAPRRHDGCAKASAEYRVSLSESSERSTKTHR